MNVWLVEPNYRFGTNAFLPYAIARLWAHAITSDTVSAAFNLGGWVIFREPIDDVMQRLTRAEPDVLACSTYIWNAAYIEELVKRVRDKYPNVVVVSGGPQTPDPLHFDGDHFADVLINGEGEVAFKEYLEYSADGVCKPVMTHHTGDKARIPDLAELTSPYLSGVLDEFVSDKSFNWHALQETNRGCPYQCTFCDWGSATFSQVRQFPIDVILDEIDWFEQNEIELLYNCDANFGMLKRDVDIAKSLVACKERSGFPDKFRAAYAKKTTPQVYETASILAKADMSKGVTLSVQSMDVDVLQAVKRRAINEEEYEDLVSRYGSEDVPTYTEIILGLPNETPESFRTGINRLMELGQHEGINVYPAILLQNSEMNAPEYKAKYQIQTVGVPMLLLHGSPGDDPCPEQYELIVSTSTMTRQEWIDALVFAWTVQGLHCLGFLRADAIDRNNDGLSFRDYYDHMVYRSPILAGLIADMRSTLTDTINGVGNWNVVDPKYGDVTFPLEELLFMRAVEQSDDIYVELGVGFPMIKACRADFVDPSEYPDLKTWARESVWYSRKGKRKK
jgi:putative methyltransferase